MAVQQKSRRSVNPIVIFPVVKVLVNFGATIILLIYLFLIRFAIFFLHIVFFVRCRDMIDSNEQPMEDLFFFPIGNLEIGTETWK